MNTDRNITTQFIDLGLKDFKASWDYQLELFNATLEIKSNNRHLSPDKQVKTPNFLLLVEHPHVYTLGKSGKQNHLLISNDQLKTLKATFYHINRGGDITYHGPGQIVGYPILDLENFFTDIHKYMRLLEEVIINTLADFGIPSGRIEGLTGVWVDHENVTTSRKICAFGVKTSRWVTQHGFALNVNTDLSYFDYIVPCGISNRSVTSMEKELGKSVELETVKTKIKGHFSKAFGLTLL